MLFRSFLCLVYVYICLFRLVLCFLYVFNHIRLLDLHFLLFGFYSVFVILGFLGKDLCTLDLAYAHRLNSCVRRLVLASMMSLPRNPNFFVCFVSVFICLLCVVSFSYVFKPHNCLFTF